MRLLPTFTLVLALAVAAAPAEAQLATPNADGITFGHVHLNVTDIEAQKKIWVDWFDGKVVREGPLTTIKLPNFLITMSETEPTGPTQGSVMNHFGFKVRNTAEFLERWTATGMEAGEIFTGAEGMPNAYVMAPDGVWVELQEDPSLHVPITGYHVHFWTPGHEELLDWYSEVFNLRIRPRGRIQTTTDVPGMNMSFAGSDVPTAPTRGRSLDHIGFEVDDLEAFCEKLKAKGVEFDVEYHEVENSGLKSAFLTDPAGTYVELTEGYDEY